MKRTENGSKGGAELWFKTQGVEVECTFGFLQLPQILAFQLGMCEINGLFSRWPSTNADAMTALHEQGLIEITHFQVWMIVSVSRHWRLLNIVETHAQSSSGYCS